MSLKTKVGCFCASHIVQCCAYALLIAGLASPAEAQQKEIVVTVSEVRLLDKADTFNRAEIYSRIIIAGEWFETPVVKSSGTINPNWRANKSVNAGDHAIKLEILDRDLTMSEPVDINKVDRKRDVDLVVDTRNCRVSGDGINGKCDVTLKTTGRERKSAEVTITVSVR